MTAIVFLPVLAAALCLTFAGGWYLRGLQDRYRAEVERDAQWDAEHEIGRTTVP